MRLCSFAFVLHFLISISTISSQSLSPSDPSMPFLISFQTPNRSSSSFRKEDNPERYITANGRTINECRLSANYTINNQGQLIVDGTGGYATSDGIVSQPFVPSDSEGKILGAWQFFFGELQWYNEAFIGGYATVCIDRASGLVLIYFLERTPLTCRPISLHYMHTSACSEIESSGNGENGSESAKTEMAASTVRPSKKAADMSSSNGRLATYAIMSSTLKKTATTQPIPTPTYGLAYNAYINPFNIANDLTWRDDFASMGPSYFNNNSNYLVTCGIAYDMRIVNDDIYTSINGYLPGQSILTDLEHIAVVFHGYFIPPAAGTYQFSAKCDDWGYVWLGASTAFSAWNEYNWVASNRAGGPTISGPLVVETGGELIPTTFLCANAGQRFTCLFGIIFPNGSQTSDFAGLFRQPAPSTWDEWVPSVRNKSTCPAPLAYTDGDGGGN